MYYLIMHMTSLISIYIHILTFNFMFNHNCSYFFYFPHSYILIYVFFFNIVHSFIPLCQSLLCSMFPHHSPVLPYNTFRLVTSSKYIYKSDTYSSIFPPLYNISFFSPYHTYSPSLIHSFAVY